MTLILSFAFKQTLNNYLYNSLYKTIAHFQLYNVKSISSLIYSQSHSNSLN